MVGPLDVFKDVVTRLEKSGIDCYREGGSEKHLTDIRGILGVPNLC